MRKTFVYLATICTAFPAVSSIAWGVTAGQCRPAAYTVTRMADGSNSATTLGTLRYAVTQAENCAGSEVEAKALRGGKGFIQNRCTVEARCQYNRGRGFHCDLHT